MGATPQNDRVNNLTLQDYNSTAVDTISKSSALLKRATLNPDRWNGRSYSTPIITNNSTNGESFKGTETFDTAIDYNTQQLTWYPTGYAQPVGVSIVEQSINATPAGVIDLYKSSYQYAQNSMVTNLGNILYGFGLGNDFDGLGNIVDDGTNTTTYGGLSRATYPSINAFLTSATNGTLTLDLMRAADDGSTISGNESESSNTILSGRTVWSLYDSLLEPTVRASYNGMGGAFIGDTSGVGSPATQSNALKLNYGATSLTFRGKDYVRDDKAPTGTQWFINDKWFHFRSLKLKGLDVIGIQEDVTAGAYDGYTVSTFQFREPMMPVNQLAEVGIFVMYGQWFCTNPNRNAKISGITNA